MLKNDIIKRVLALAAVFALLNLAFGSDSLGSATTLDGWTSQDLLMDSSTGPSGTLDTSFNGTGLLYTSAPGDISAAEAQNDGKLIAVGSARGAVEI